MSFANMTPAERLKASGLIGLIVVVLFFVVHIMLGAVSPKFFGCNEASELAAVKDLTGMLAQPKYAKEVYQDFRGQPPSLPEFQLYGPDLENVTKSEAAGFRITLPKTRKVNLSGLKLASGIPESSCTMRLL